MDTQPSELDNEIDKRDLKNNWKSSQKATKKIVKKFENLKGKEQLANYGRFKKSKDDGVVFIRQVPVHPRDTPKKQQ